MFVSQMYQEANGIILQYIYYIAVKYVIVFYGFFYIFYFSIWTHNKISIKPSAKLILKLLSIIRSFNANIIELRKELYNLSVIYMYIQQEYRLTDTCKQRYLTDYTSELRTLRHLFSGANKCLVEYVHHQKEIPHLLIAKYSTILIYSEHHVPFYRLSKLILCISTNI